MKMKKLMVAALAAAITVGSALPASAALVQSGPSYKYQNNDGTYQTNAWVQDSGKWYHLDEKGYVEKGWFKDTDGKWYFLAYNGVMQTGLIKVDDNVYFMNTDGSLFVGKKTIDNTEYNFTEYGTTNGKPFVTSAQSWGGNGNQGINIGNSSHSGSSHSGNNTSVTTIEQMNKTVESAVNNTSNEYVKTSFSQTSTKNIISVESKSKEDGTLENVLDSAGSILNEIQSTEGVKSVTWNGIPVMEESQIESIIKDKGYENKKLSDFSGKSYTITVTLDNDKEVPYKISIK